MSERKYDVILFGATGFTGTLTAEYLARAAAGGPATLCRGRFTVLRFRSAAYSESVARRTASAGRSSSSSGHR